MVREPLLPRDALVAACHDVCAPLAAIRLQAQAMRARLARGAPLDPTVLLDFVTRAERLSGSAARIMRDALTGEGRREIAGRRGPQPVAAFELEEALETAISFHAEALQEARCSIVVTRDRDAARLRGAWDRRALESIFSNLLQNSCRYAAGATIRVHLSRGDGRVVVCFADDGPDLPTPDAREGGRSGGLGLGLRIVRAAVIQLGGELSVRSEPGRGVSFEIRLPA